MYGQYIHLYQERNKVSLGLYAMELLRILPQNHPTSMQRATDQSAKWSKENKLGINATKTKEILISFGQDNSLPLIELNGGFIERVNQSKLLGVNI